MKTRKARAIAITLAYLLSVVLVYAVSLAMMCPDHYTQAQVDTAGCSIGANIGAGFIIMTLTIIWIVALAIILPPHEK